MGVTFDLVKKRPYLKTFFFCSTKMILIVLSKISEKDLT